MLSHNQEKLLRKLTQRKHRWKEKLFVAEGRKVVQELLSEGLQAEFLVACEGSDWEKKEAVILPGKAFQKWSGLSHGDEVLGVFAFPNPILREGNLSVVLDGVKDPGNLGTIIRTCDWFGVSALYCCQGTADIFNPKTVQSTMGSIARLKVEYATGEEIYDRLAADHQFWMADMKGEELQKTKLNGKVALVMGSESHGPSPYWQDRAKAITIPRLTQSKAESLNVAVATAVILSHLALPRP